MNAFDRIETRGQFKALCEEMAPDVEFIKWTLDGHAIVHVLAEQTWERHKGLKFLLDAKQAGIHVKVSRTVLAGWCGEEKKRIIEMWR